MQKNPQIGRTKSNRYPLVGKCIKCGGMKIAFVSKSDAQNENGLLLMLGINIPLAEIPIHRDLIF